jgi:hypothetical protein
MRESGPNPRPIALTEPQRRHLAVLLDRIEAALSEVTRLAVAPPRDRVLMADLADLPPDLPALVSPEAERVRRAIRDIAERFHLERQAQSRRRRSQALVGTAIVQAEDARSRALHGYGPVGPALVQALDPLVEEIVHALVAVAVAIESDADPGRAQAEPR